MVHFSGSETQRTRVAGLNKLKKAKDPAELQKITNFIPYISPT